MTRRLVHLGCLAAIAVSSPLGAQAGAAGQFIPLVPAADTTAQCEKTTAAALQPDERGFLLRFAPRNGVERVVSAVWDTAGHLRRYSDARGDLRGPPATPAERGPRTTISIDLVKGIALLLNEDHGQNRGSSMATASAALASDRLDRPRDLLARLHTQCGAPPS